jgi:hypothetical protein
MPILKSEGKLSLMQGGRGVVFKQVPKREREKPDSF